MMEGKEGKRGRRQSAWETEEILGLAIFLLPPFFGALLPASIRGCAALAPSVVPLIHWIKRYIVQDLMKKT